MRAAAAAVLDPNASFQTHELDELQEVLRGQVTQLASVVESVAGSRPVESVSRECALDEVESARVLLTTSPEPDVWGAVKHVKSLAREVRALCDQHDMLAGVWPPPGAAVGVNPVRTLSWCEACREVAESVERVVISAGQRRPEWGIHACGPCRERLGLAAAPREPGRAVRIR